jgi:hypothetical protein
MSVGDHNDLAVGAAVVVKVDEQCVGWFARVGVVGVCRAASTVAVFAAVTPRESGSEYDDAKVVGVNLNGGTGSNRALRESVTGVSGYHAGVMLICPRCNAALTIDDYDDALDIDFELRADGTLRVTQHRDTVHLCRTAVSIAMSPPAATEPGSLPPHRPSRLRTNLR